MSNKKIKLNFPLPEKCRSAKKLRDNGIFIDKFFMIDIDEDLCKILSLNNVKIHQKYFIIGEIISDKNGNPKLYTIAGSERDLIKNIPWDCDCIKKVYGSFLK